MKTILNSVNLKRKTLILLSLKIKKDFVKHITKNVFLSIYSILLELFDIYKCVRCLQLKTSINNDKSNSFINSFILKRY